MEVNLSDTNFKQEVLESEVPVLVDFWASWCKPCRAIAPTIETLAKEYQGKLKVCKLSIEDASNTASSYGIMSVPAFAIFKNGKIMEQMSGNISKRDLESKIRPYLQ